MDNISHESVSFIGDEEFTDSNEEGYSYVELSATDSDNDD